MEKVTYDPNRLIDFAIEALCLKNDWALAKRLEFTAPAISKMRHGRLPIGAAFLVRLSEITQIPTKELREIMGDRRRKFRVRNKGVRKVYIEQRLAA